MNRHFPRKTCKWPPGPGKDAQHRKRKSKPQSDHILVHFYVPRNIFLRYIVDLQLKAILRLPSGAWAHLIMFRRYFWLAQLWRVGDATGIYWVEARGAAKRPAMGQAYSHVMKVLMEMTYKTHLY